MSRSKTKPAPRKRQKRSGTRTETRPESPAANGHANGHAEGFTAPVKDYRRVEQHPTSKNNRRNALIASYRPEYAAQASAMVANGATERDIRVALQVTRTVFDTWKTVHAEFAAALAIGKGNSLATAAVARSVFEMAVGHTQRQTKIVVADGVIKKVKYNERIPKNISAAKFWLMNMDPVNWGKDPDRDKANAALPGVLNPGALKGMNTEQLRHAMIALQALLTAGGPSTGLKRLDVIDAQVIPPDPGFKPRKRRTKATDEKKKAKS